MRRPPILLIEQLSLGELDDDQATAVQEELIQVEGGLQRIDALREEDQQLLEEHPPTQFLAKLRTHQDARRTRRVMVGSTLALAASAALFVPSLMDSDTTRTKGLSPHLEIIRLDDAGPTPVIDGDVVQTGDQLQVFYVAAQAQYGMVLSVDGRGTLSQHLPQQGHQAVPLSPDGVITLPSSYLLDDAPRFERFFLVTGPRTFVHEEVEHVLIGWEHPEAPSSLPADLRISAITLRKAPPP